MTANPDKRWIRRSFGAAAQSYDGVAALQRAIGERLLAYPLEIAPMVVLDVGTGTGYCAERLLEHYPETRLIALDIAEGMARMARQRVGGKAEYLCGDAEYLPLADQSVELVVSNLAIQWCVNLAEVFREFRRVLKPGGMALFSTFGADTLRELRSAWAAVDHYSHVNEFADAATIVRALDDGGFAACGVTTETRVLSYPDVHALMRELKSLGAHNMTADRPRHLTGKNALRRMLAAYAAQSPDSTIRASFEVVYGYAIR